MSAASRWPAIDLLRGLTVVVMILVNQWAGVSGLPDWMKHYPADADAMSFVDMVFPAFLFIVGMSIPLALQARAHEGRVAALQAVALRSAGLLLLGLWMVNAEMAPAEWSQAWPRASAWLLGGLLAAFLVWGSVSGGPPLRWPWRLLGLLVLALMATLYPRDASGSSLLQVHWWGILGLIGWAYALSALLYLLSPARARLAIVLLALPLCVVWRIGLDSHLGGGAHATHCLLVLAGVAATLLMQREAVHALRWVGALALLLLLSGLLMRPLLGLSKIQATPAWGLICAGASMLLFLLLQLALQRWPAACARWLRAMQAPGRHPLLAYLLPFVIGSLMVLLGWRWPAALSHGAAGVLGGFLFLIAVLLLLQGLLKWRIALRL